MTIAILKQEPDHKIPRPYNRACSFSEMVEMLAGFAARQGGGNITQVKAAMLRAAADPNVYATALGMKMMHLDTDYPVLVLGSAKFYAFTEN